MKIVTTATLTCQSHGLTTKRPLIVCLIHGSRNVLKPSKCHLPYETFSHSMRMWKTTLVLITGKNTLNAGDVNINSGIFQELSLSPILSCVTLIPLSKPLNNTGYSYKIYDNIINHFFYMGDLKLFAKNDLKPQGLLNIVN